MRKFTTLIWGRSIFYPLILLALLFPSLHLTAQETEQELKGVVLEPEGAPIAGASVTVLRKKTGEMTDAQGRFTIRVIKGDKITVSFVGKLSTTITYNAQSNLRITLQDDPKSLDAVIVSTGYQNLNRKLFTGSATKVNAKDVERTGLADATKMLEGQVAGLSLQNVSGTFGAAPRLRIRGATSLSGDNKPLWVVDGIILEDVVNISNEALSTGDASTLLGSAIAGLNPDDIESFNILKDAAATAMYGARAMNGVIVVTTKKGRSTGGSPRISYTSNLSTYLKPQYSDFDILNSADQMAIMIEMLNKGYYQIPGASRSSDGGVFYKLYNKLYDYDPATDTYALKNDIPTRNAFLNRYANANTDWFDVLFRSTLLQEHSLSVSSGSDKVQNYASASFMKDNGITIGNSVDRFTGNFRSNFKFSNKFRGELLTTGTVRNQRAPGTSNQNSDPVYGSYYRGFDINPYTYVQNTSRLITENDENGNPEYFVRNFAPFNIVNELNTNYMKLQSLDFKVQLGLKYNFTPALAYSLDGAMRYVKAQNQTYILENSNMARAFRVMDDATIVGSNPNLYKDPNWPNNLPVSVLPEGGFYKVANNNLRNYYFRQNLEYDATIREDHKMNFFGSMEVRSTDKQNEFFDGVGYQYENGGLVNANNLYFKQAAETGKPYFGMGNNYERFIAYMFRGAYAYKGKYSINFTTRYDGSNLMGKSTVARWLPTWNVSGAWDIDQEEFWFKKSWFSSARVRATYGLVASLGNATNSAAVFYNMIARRPYANDQETLTLISNLENSELTWEKNKEFNLGFDLGFNSDKVIVNIDLYNRNIYDLIGPIQTSGIGGEYVKLGNYGTMNSKGAEFTISGFPVRTKDFSWRTQFNIAYNKNEITKLEIAPNIWRSISNNGGPVLNHPSRGLFSIQFAGLDHNYGYPTFIGEDNKTTTIIPLQSNALDYLKYEGPIDPLVTGGFYNQISYKGFVLSGLVKYSFGNVLRLTPNISAGYSDMTSMTKDMLNRWVKPGDEQFTTIPAIMDPLSLTKIVDANGGQVDPRYPYNAYNYSTERVAKGDYIKLSQVSLAYQLPRSFCEKLKMTNASVAAVANNIMVLYADKRLNGQDPEFYASGGVALPVPKQVTFSLKVGF